LLPYPDEAKERKVSDRTLQTLVNLIDKGKLPPRVMAAAMMLEEVKDQLEVLKQEGH